MRLSKKKKELMFIEIKDIVAEMGFLSLEKNWKPQEIDIRSTYDAFRIIDVLEEHLKSKSNGEHI